MCEDEILNATETALDHEKVRCEKNNCIIHVSLIIIFLLLLILIFTLNILQSQAFAINMKNLGEKLGM